MSSLDDFAELSLVLRCNAQLPGNDVVDDDLVAAIVRGATDFADGPWGDISRIGDTVGARLEDGTVTMPPGFVDAYKAFVAAQWGAVGIDEEHGGQGLPYPLAMAVVEVLGRSNFALTGCATLTIGAAEAIARHGTAAQREEYLPHLATGAWNGTMNITEPHAGSDVGAIRTMAVPRSDGSWSIRGTKIFITFGDHDLTGNVVHLVLARTPDAPVGTAGLSLFLVPKLRRGDGGDYEDNHVRVASIEHKLGFHASPTCMMVFGESGACVGELVGELHTGMRCMFTMMNSARIAVGLQGVQLGEAATRQAVRFARERIQGRREGAPAPIVEHADVRRMLMRMKALTQAARALMFYTAGCLERAKQGSGAETARLELLTPVAKTYGSEVGVEIASLGIQVHGGMGYIEETGAAQYWRDARIAPIYEGTSGIQAADLVVRKLPLSDGAAFAGLIADMRDDVTSASLKRLVDDCEEAGKHILQCVGDDRLAPSYPFLRMLAVATAGWQLELQLGELQTGMFAQSKRCVVAHYLDYIVPEASGLKAAAMAPADHLYSISAEAL